MYFCKAQGNVFGKNEKFVVAVFFNHTLWVLSCVIQKKCYISTLLYYVTVNRNNVIQKQCYVSTLLYFLTVSFF